MRRVLNVRSTPYLELKSDWFHVVHRPRWRRQSLWGFTVATRAWFFFNAWMKGTVFPSHGTVTHPRKLGDSQYRSCLRPAGQVAYMPTYSRAAEWNASKIIVDVCVDLHAFCWNVHLIWQYFVDRRKVNAWAWLLMMCFSYISFMAKIKSWIL